MSVEMRDSNVRLALSDEFARAARQIRDADLRQSPEEAKLVTKKRLIDLENRVDFASYKIFLELNRENPNVRVVAQSVKNHLGKDIFTRKKPATVNELRKRSFCERIITPIAVAAIIAAGAVASSFL